MGIFLVSLAVLAGSTVGLGLCALFLRGAWGRLANVAGPAALVLGCGLGLWALTQGAWDSAPAAHIPWGLPFGSGSLGLDSLSRIFLIPVFGLGAVCALAGCVALRHYPPEEHNLAAHWCFFSLLVLALALVIAARDAVLFMLSWELMSLAPFFLIDFDDNEEEVRRASWIYLVAAHLGAVLLMALFALLWQTAGTTHFASFADVAALVDMASGAQEAGLQTSGLASVLFVLALLGFGAKAGLSPFHIWLPEAHPVAPSHVSALLSGAMINAGLYGILRVLGFLGPLATAPGWWGWALLGLGLGTGLVGIFKATAQRNLKRLLAYSSVENMGIMLMGLGAGLIGCHAGSPWIATLGFAASLFHMLNHAAFKALLFLCAGEILHAVHTVALDHLGGLQKKLPFLGALFGLGAASIACLPPFNGFASELTLALSLAGGIELKGMGPQLGLLGALVGLALISGLAAATFAKAYGIAFLGEARTGAAQNPAPVPSLALAVLALPAAACLLLSLAAPQVFALLSPAALTLQQAGTAAGGSAGAAAGVLAEAAAGVHGSAAVGGSAEAAAVLAEAAGVVHGSAVVDPRFYDAVAHMGTILSFVVAIGLGGIALTLVLTAWRAARLNLLPQGGLRRGPTWGCGYQAGSARVQYKGASFSEPLARIFARATGIRSRLTMDPQIFPSRASLQVKADDRLLTHVYSPLFARIEGLCNSLKIVQHGRIHLYILYMLATVVALLAWGLHA